MTKKELLKMLALQIEHSKTDPEAAHAEADEMLLEYIGDRKVAEAFRDIYKWYS